MKINENSRYQILNQYMKVVKSHYYIVNLFELTNIIECVRAFEHDLYLSTSLSDHILKFKSKKLFII